MKGVKISAMSRNRANDETDKQTRIAIVNADKCKPKRCRQECKRSCPVVRMGKLCIEVTPNQKIAAISEELCIGCGICVKVCYAIAGITSCTLGAVDALMRRFNLFTKTDCSQC